MKALLPLKPHDLRGVLNPLAAQNLRAFDPLHLDKGVDDLADVVVSAMYKLKIDRIVGRGSITKLTPVR
jgi:hypothetical protein